MELADKSVVSAGINASADNGTKVFKEADRQSFADDTLEQTRRAIIDSAKEELFGKGAESNILK